MVHYLPFPVFSAINGISFLSQPKLIILLGEGEAPWVLRLQEAEDGKPHSQVRGVC